MSVYKDFIIDNLLKDRTINPNLTLYNDMNWKEQREYDLCDYIINTYPNDRHLLYFDPFKKVYRPVPDGDYIFDLIKKLLELNYHNENGLFFDTDFYMYEYIYTINIRLIMMIHVYQFGNTKSILQYIKSINQHFS